MTNKEKTFCALNSAYLMSNNAINEGYLNETLQLYLANERKLYDAMHNKRLKPHSVVWQALTYDANTRLTNEEYPKEYMCTSDQLKAWLKEYGRGYDTLQETIDYIIEERNG